MKRLALFVSIILLSTTSCDVLQQMSEISSFAKCDFSINHVGVDKLGGIDVSSFSKDSDFEFTHVMYLGQQLLSGKLPAELVVGIEARNNQSKKAAISGFDWQIFMKNESYGQGSLNEYVEVMPGTSTDFKVKVNFDLVKLLHSEDIQSVIDLVLDIENREKLEKLDISVKIKPYYKSGGKIHEYPGFITIKP